MKIKNIKCIFSILIIIFALTSCDKNELNNFETIKVKNGYSVENGYIKFENINEYKALYEKLSNASKLELEIWNKNLPFKSLELKYNEDNIQMYVADNNLTNEMGEQLNTKRLNPTLASLFNENGVLVINDTILKVKNEFLYSITNGLNSTCKCNRILINNLFKFFVWREVSKSFTRSIIEFIFNPLNLFVGYFTKVLTLWDILPDKPVGVFIGTTFP